MQIRLTLTGVLALDFLLKLLQTHLLVRKLPNIDRAESYSIPICPPTLRACSGAKPCRSVMRQLYHEGFLRGLPTSRTRLPLLASSANSSMQ